jgi:hypothetical protein
MMCCFGNGAQAEDTKPGPAPDAGPAQSPSSPLVLTTPSKSCGCTTGCGNNKCGCRKAGRACSQRCACRGACSNSGGAAAPATPVAGSTTPRVSEAAGAASPATGHNEGAQAPFSPKSTQKKKVHVKVCAGNDPERMALHAKLGDLLRDGGISTKMQAVQQAWGPGDYYLRNTRARVLRPDSAEAQKLQVDHSFECQLLAHSLETTAEFRDVLRNVDVTSRSDALSRQPKAVENALGPLYATHNGGADYRCFNLRALSADLNIKKGQCYRAYLNRQRAAESGTSPVAVYDVRTQLQASCINSGPTVRGPHMHRTHRCRAC